MNSDGLLSDSLFIGNGMATCLGGAIYLAASASVKNSILIGNIAKQGGGIYKNSNCAPQIRNLTLYHNAAELGGGAYCGYMSGDNFKNCIFWENEASVEGPEVYCNSPGVLQVSYCLVRGGAPGVENFDADPCFADPEGLDLHLTKNSPCINRGTLEADGFEVSLGGGSVSFTLKPGIQYAGKHYLLLGGNSGTAPGTPLPGGHATLALNWDPITEVVLAFLNTSPFSGFLGTVDATGSASAQLNLPPLPAGSAGTALQFAYCVGKPFHFASNPVPTTIVP
jgi:hypothetical protein